MEYQCDCKTCGGQTFIDRPFRIDIKRIKGLNKPFTRSGLVFGNVLHLIDSMISIITLETLGSNLGSEYIKRDLDKFAQYDENCGDNFKFKLEPFDFKLYKMGPIRRPFTRSGKIFGHSIRMIDYCVGIITFHHFETFLSHEVSSRDLNKLGRFINKYGIEGLTKN